MTTADHAKKRDAVLLRMLKTPPEPHKPLCGGLQRQAEGQRKKRLRTKKASAGHGQK